MTALNCGNPDRTVDDSSDRCFGRFFDRDPECARKQVALLRAKLSRYFAWRHGASPEEMVSETLCRALTQISKGAAVPNLDSFCYGIASNILREGWKRKPEGELTDDLPGPDTAPAGQLCATEQSLLLEECLRMLSADERALLKQYFWEDRKQVAERLNISPTALRIRVFRILRKIRERVAGSGDSGGAV
jgi:RNA polymerase sigma factor (sigma-70 family)